MRLARGTFWRLFAFTLIAAAVMLSLLPDDLFLARPGWHGMPLPPLPAKPLAAVLMCVPVGWLGAWRLHDVGQRGWHAWLPLLAVAFVKVLPAIGLPWLLSLALWAQTTELPSYAAGMGRPLVIAIWLTMLLLAAGVLRTVFYWLQPGEAGENRYGPAPDGPAVVQQPARLQGRFLNGRMARLPFWLIVVANTALVYGAKYALAWVGQPGLLSWISAFLYLPSFAAAVLRLHDRGRNGLLPMLLFPAAAAAPLAEMFLTHSQVNGMNIAIDLATFYLLFLCWQPGEADDNAYGPPPGSAQQEQEIAMAMARPAPAAPSAMRQVLNRPAQRPGFGRRGV